MFSNESNNEYKLTKYKQQKYSDIANREYIETGREFNFKYDDEYTRIENTPIPQYISIPNKFKNTITNDVRTCIRTNYIPHTSPRCNNFEQWIQCYRNELEDIDAIIRRTLEYYSLNKNENIKI